MRLRKGDANAFPFCFFGGRCDYWPKDPSGTDSLSNKSAWRARRPAAIIIVAAGVPAGLSYISPVWSQLAVIPTLISRFPSWSVPPLDPKDPFLGQIDSLHALFVTTGCVGMMTPGQSSPGIEDLLSGSVRGYFQDEEVLLQCVVKGIARGSAVALEKLRRNPVVFPAAAHLVLPSKCPERGLQ